MSSGASGNPEGEIIVDLKQVLKKIGVQCPSDISFQVERGVLQIHSSKDPEFSMKLGDALALCGVGPEGAVLGPSRRSYNETGIAFIDLEIVQRAVKFAEKGRGFFEVCQVPMSGPATAPSVPTHLSPLPKGPSEQGRGGHL